MKMFRNLNIRNKLALVLWGAALLAFAVAGGGLMLFDRLTLEGRVSQAMEPYAQLVSVGAEAAVAFEDSVRAQAILDTLRANPQIIEAAILLEDGRTLASYSPSSPAKPVHPRADVNGVHLRDHTAQFVHGLQRRGKLSLTMDLDQFTSQTRLLRWMAGVALLVLLVITLGQIAVLQRTIIRPIASRKTRLYAPSSPAAICDITWRRSLGLSPRRPYARACMIISVSVLNEKW